MRNVPRGHEENCKVEVVELHQFFEDWFNGQIGAEDFDRFAGVLAQDFTMIGPDGRLTHSQPLLEALGEAGGSKNGLQIWIENTVVLARDGDLTLAVYDECQDLKGKENRRRSTVLFRDKPVNPNGLEWIHVHETWLERE